MTVTYEVRDRVAVVTIDRPDKRNAMSMEVFRGLADAAARAAEDDAARAVLVRGADGNFSSGIDTSVLGQQSQDGEIDHAFIRELQDAFNAYEDLDKATVAAVEGVCFGAGVQLAAACHLRAIAPTASLSVMEVRWGLVPDLGGTYRLPRLIGLGRATELVATGRRVGADEALRIGLGEVAVAHADGAFELAASLAAGPAATPRAIRLLRENLTRDRDRALHAEREAQIASIGGPDFAEAVQARLDGREPAYVGR